VQEQHFDAELPEDLEVRAVLRRGVAVRRDVVDGVLPVLHPPDVGGERDGLRVGLLARGREAEQLRKTLAVRRVFWNPFLQHAAKRGPERGVLVGLLVAQLLERPQHALHGFRADGLHVA
jgi:hypothetical protein